MAFSIFSDLIQPTKYEVPNAPQLDATQNQLETTQGNAATFAAAKELASQYDDFMAQQFKKAFPQFQGLQESGGDAIAKMLRGELSTGDVAASQRSSAARALGLGTSGSDFGKGLSIYDLGRTQQQQVSQGLAALPGYTAAVQGTKRLFDPSTMFLNPVQRFQQSMINQQNQWNVSNLRNQMAVQPSPGEKALAGFGDTMMNAFGILGSRYISGTGFGQSGFSGAGAEGAANNSAINTSGWTTEGAGMGSGEGVTSTGYSG